MSAPLDWIELEIDRCTLVYGEAPCQAALGVTGQRKCFNAWSTCQDRDQFASAPYRLRFVQPHADLPRDPVFAGDGLVHWLPLVQDIRHSPPLPDPGRSIGVRAELRVTLQDAPYHDIGIDKYALERRSGAAQLDEGPYDPGRRSTLWTKLLARFPHYVGRRLRWHRGFVGGAIVTREYVVERIIGPDGHGRVELVAKDPLKLADRERAQAPRPSLGRLAADLSAEANPEFIDVQTPDPSEYPSTQWIVFIGKEGLIYNSATVLNATTVRLNGITRSLAMLDSGYQTERKAHKAGDTVQVALWFGPGWRLVDVVHHLLTHAVPGFDPAWIDLQQWRSEYDLWFGGLEIRRLIAEPEGVAEMITEIVEQTLTWGFWWDEAAQKVRYRATAPPDLGEQIPRLTDANHLIKGSVELIDEPERVANEIQVIFGQIDPTGRRDDRTNYVRVAIRADTDSQSGRELGQRRTHRVFARWHPAVNESFIHQYLTRELAARATKSHRVEFRLARQDGEGLAMGTHAWVETAALVDDVGRPRPARVQLVRAEAEGDELVFRGREDVFAGVARVFGRLAPPDLHGLTYAGANAARRDRYAFLANAAGEMSDATEGYRLL